MCHLRTVKTFAQKLYDDILSVSDSIASTSWYAFFTQKLTETFLSVRWKYNCMFNDCWDVGTDLVGSKLTC